MHLIDQFENYQTGGTWSGALGPLLERREKQSVFELVATAAVDEIVVRAADAPKLTLDLEAPD